MSQHLTTPPDTKEMPGGIPYIIGNEAAERFSFYGMKAILFVYMTKYLYMLDMSGEPTSMDVNTANAWVHNFNTAVYFFPFLGAVVSDWLFGKYRTIMWLSVVYCVGHGVLALLELPPGLLPLEPKTLLWLGLALIAVGSGGIKPCVSAHVGDQFGRSNQHLVSRVFRAFYFSVNLGSALATVLTPLLLHYLGPGWAFGIPGVLMALATLTFWLGRHTFVHVPPAGTGFFKETFGKNGVRALLNLVPLYVFIAMFWALFDQTSSAWVEQATNMNRVLFRWGSGEDAWVAELLPSQIQAANPFLVMILIPVFALFVYPLMGRFFEVTPLRKIGIGLFLTVPAFAIPAVLEQQISAGQQPHIVWHLVAYVVITAAEVLVSITALEFSYTQAPPKMKSFVMGAYLLSVALGNKFTALVNESIVAQREKGVELLNGSAYYWFFTIAMLVTAVIYVGYSQFYRGESYYQGQDEPDGATKAEATAEAVAE